MQTFIAMITEAHRVGSAKFLILPTSFPAGLGPVVLSLEHGGWELVDRTGQAQCQEKKNGWLCISYDE
jgi:hypothetical protein